MNYDEVKAMAQLYADRTDIDVVRNMDNFILMAEARMNRVLRVGEQTHRIYTNTVTDREYYTLPPEYNGMRVLQFNEGKVDASKVIKLEYVTPEALITLQANDDNSGTIHYTVINNQIQLHQTLPGGGTLEIVFYRKVPRLTSTNPSNWMSNDHPDVYVSGVSAEIELFVKNYDASKLWDDRMSRGIEEIRENDIGNRWVGAPMAIRTE